MLESLVAWVLNNYVGDYLENLNTEQLSVAFLSGQMELENVPLKKTALRKLDLPLSVRNGILGKLTLSVPVTRVRSEAWTLRLSDVLILLGPDDQAKYDAEVEEAADLARKQAQLDELERLHQNELCTALGTPVTSNEESSWWGASLLSTVLNNIQLIVSNIHIRYEDPTTLGGGRTFCAGVRIQHLLVQTTNHRWKPGFVEPQDGVNIFKKFELKGFIFYWNSGENISSDVKTVKDLQKLLSPENLGCNSYVIAPCCSELRMEKNASKLPLKEKIPRFKLQLRPDSITVELSRAQRREMRTLTKQWARFERARPHRKWRPIVPVHGNCREWWGFAVSRVVAECRLDSLSRRTWPAALSRARHLTVYARAYKRRLLYRAHNSATIDDSNEESEKPETKPSSEDRTVMRQIERDPQYTFSELSIIRDVVFARLLRENGVEKEKATGDSDESESPFDNIASDEVDAARRSVPANSEPTQAGGGGLLSWMTSFFSSAADENHTEEKNEFGPIDLGELKSNLPKELRDIEKQVDKEILDVLHDSWDDSTLLRKDFLLADIALRIDRITLRLTDTSTSLDRSSPSPDGGRVLSVELFGVASQLEVSPRTHTLTLSLSVQNMNCQSLQLMPSSPTAEEDDGPLFSLSQNTQVLFAVGRVGDDLQESGEINRNPLFRLLYRRQSLRATRHTVEASFQPLTGICEQHALARVWSLLSDEGSEEEEEAVGMAEESSAASRSPSSSLSLQAASHLIASVSFPSIRMELRRPGEGLLAVAGEPSCPVAAFCFDNLHLTAQSTQLDLTEINISVGHVEIEDKFEESRSSLLTTSPPESLSLQRSSVMSSSMPQLHVSSCSPANISSGFSGISGSLPNQSLLDDLTVPIEESRKTSEAASVCGGMGLPAVKEELTLHCSLVREGHPLFLTKYNKCHCVVEVDVSNMEATMNRRTWTVLLDMAGLLGEEESQPGKESAVAATREQLPPAPLVVACSLRVSSFRLHMAYPADITGLGTITVSDLLVVTKVRVGDVGEALRVDVSLASLSISDHTPVHSLHYDTRLLLRGDSHSRAHLRIIKYTEGVEEGAECDMRVEADSGPEMTLLYVHTHRFLCSFIDFWQQFAELQDIIIRNKHPRRENGLRSRIALDVRLQSATDILLPQSFESEEILHLRAESLELTNVFLPASQLSDLIDEFYLERETDDGKTVIDCLLDNAACTLSGVRLHEAKKIRKSGNASGNDLDCSTFCVRSETRDIFSRPFDLTVNVIRNLSCELSHALPDLSILYCLRDVNWEVSSRFYALLRGFLEMNLGEELIPVPESIPFEVLHRPVLSCEVGSEKRYATLSVRVSFENVSVECSVGVGVANLGPPFSPLACLELQQSRLSFDVLDDGQAELDLICERARVLDARSGSAAIAAQYGPVLAPLPDSTSRLLLEAHLMLRKGQAPVLTVVLLHSRVVVLPDFLNDIKDFILISPHAPEPPPAISRPRAVSSGVLGRAAALLAPSALSPQPTNTVKVTMRNSDLVLPEKPKQPDSLALLISTTTVLQLTESGGNINAHVEVQSIRLSWCLLTAPERRTTFSNDFSTTISLIMAKDVSATRGLPILLQPRLMLDVDLQHLIAKLSVNDIGALRDVAIGYARFLSSEQTSLFLHNADSGIAIGKVGLKWQECDLWFHEEMNGATLPLLRFSLHDVTMEKEGDRMKSSFTASMDYFNQRLFGWEPLIEPWKVLRLHSTRQDQNTSIELVAAANSTLDINIMEQLISQALAFQQRFPLILSSFEEKHYRRGGSGTTQHFSFLLRNSTECELTFTTAVEEVTAARAGHRRSTAKWLSVLPGSTLIFEFPTILLFYSQSEREPPRQLIVRVKGWDETSPVNVDVCGTFFRVVKALEEKLSNARVVIRVSMERDGRKQIEVSSSVRIVNLLPHAVQLFEAGTQRRVCRVEPASRQPLPLRDAALSFDVEPVISDGLRKRARVVCSRVRQPGQVRDDTHCLHEASSATRGYWLCTSVRREQYPEHDSLPGHSLHLLPPLAIRSLLPVDAQLSLSNQRHILRAGKRLQITSVDVLSEILLLLETDRFRSSSPLLLRRSSLPSDSDLLLETQLVDERGRSLALYASARSSVGGAIELSLWTPYWIVNKSGLPIVIRQEAANEDAAGQGEEHERATDRHPLLFGYDGDLPEKVTIRLGKEAMKEPGYDSLFSRRIHLTPGVHALKLELVHETLPTRYYNVGVEVRPGSGLFKDTQVVLLTPRYIINNLSSHRIFASHHQHLLHESKRHIVIASQSTLVWHENYEEASWICLRREDAVHWSCPVRIDQVRSCHVTMRAADESPVFVRMEVTLHGAVLHVSLTDAHFYPPQIQLDNLSEVPVLYQQKSENPSHSHLRTICKAKSKVDYAWNDPDGIRLLVLQVYEKKSEVYDPSRPGAGSSLIYENAFYITLLHSHQGPENPMRPAEMSDLVLEVLQKGKVVLNRQNRMDGNSGSQLWRWRADSCLENVGMSIRHRNPMVLDCIQGGLLMLTPRDSAKDHTQHWRLGRDGRMVCRLQGMAVAARTASLEVALVQRDDSSPDQVFSIERQRPGSGTLHVHCMHSGPTMVVQITDSEESSPSAGDRQSLSALASSPSRSLEITIHLRDGIGFSLVSSSSEELLYGHLAAVEIFARIAGKAIQLTASIENIQVDNQLLCSSQWGVLSCRAEHLAHSEGTPASLAIRPALKLEMHTVPRKHYDSFDVLRVRLCPLSLHLDELLLWKLLALLRSSCSSRHGDAFFLAPPDTNLSWPDVANARRCYFGTLDLQFGRAALSVVTTPKSELSPELLHIKEQFNTKLVSFEGASIELPPFRQFHYFETSSFLIESLLKFYMAELRKQTLNIIVTLDAFGNPLGLATDVIDSFQTLFIEFNVPGFVAGLGYGLSNSVSKMASAASSGVGTLRFEKEFGQEWRRSKQQAGPAPSALSHLYGGVKGLGVGVIGGATAIFTNTMQETKRSGLLQGLAVGVVTGALDTVTKPVQGLCDFVEGTASALKHATGPSGSHSGLPGGAGERRRPPRVCKGLFGLLPSFSRSMANAQIELMRINDHRTNEKLLEVEVCAEQLTGSRLVRQYVLLSDCQAYVCREDGEVSSVVHRLPYAFVRAVNATTDLPNSLACVEVTMESESAGDEVVRRVQLWCTRMETSRRLAEKLERAKHLYDHSKRSLEDGAEEIAELSSAESADSTGGCPV